MSPEVVGALIVLTFGYSGHRLDRFVRSAVSPFNVSTIRIPERPQTLEQAFAKFCGHDPLMEADWERYEEAVDLILRGKMPTANGHSPSCEAGRYPLGIDDVVSIVDNGETHAACRHCGYLISSMKPNNAPTAFKTEGLAR